MRGKLKFYVVLVLPLCLFSCTETQYIKSTVKSDNILDKRFPASPGVGEAVFYPPVPLTASSGEQSDDNLLRDPGFEAGLAYWRVSGSTPEECYRFERFAAFGDLCCQALSAAPGNVFVYQEMKLAPVSFYSFGAYVYSAGNTTVVSEARNTSNGTVVTGDSFTGPAPAWKRISMGFVTPRDMDTTDSIAVGVKCFHSRENTPVLIDQCFLRNIPGNDLLKNGSAEAPRAEAPREEEEKAPEWYLNGKEAVPVSPGYESNQAYNLSPLGSKTSKLIGFVFSGEKLLGRTVWISAMTKISPQTAATPEEVRLSLQLAGSSEEDSWILASCPATGVWAEVNLLAKVPDTDAEGTGVAPFPVVVFERPPGVQGEVLIDEIRVLPVPQDGFDGGFTGAS